MTSDDTIREQALDWAVRAGDPAFDEWDGFTHWLEADPGHARAYEAVRAAAADAAELIARSTPANDDTGTYAAPARRPGVWLAGALAAGLALVATVWTLHGSQRDLYTVATGPGDTRTIDLEAGTQVAVAGGTVIHLDRDDARFARLDRGQAYFAVRHDAKRPFTVEVGQDRMVDLGTRFDVRSDAAGLAIAVAQGAVSFDPDGAAVRIAPGEVLRRAAGSPDLVLASLPAEQVGEWREGRLTFEAATLDEVAAQLTRATGIVYAVAPGATGKVSGSIVLAPLREDPAAIGPLLGLRVRAEGERWVIGAR